MVEGGDAARKEELSVEVAKPFWGDGLGGTLEGCSFANGMYVYHGNGEYLEDVC